MTNLQQAAEAAFESVGDDGLFPNHSDKDIWINGFQAGLTSPAAKEYWEEQGWVPVEDGLPEDNEDYQVIIPCEKVPFVAHYLSKKYFLENYDEENYMDEGWYLSHAYPFSSDDPITVTHFRPLPSPPTNLQQ